QNMSGSGTYRNLDINNITDVNSTGIPTISSKLNVLSGKVLQASLNDSIILSSSATLTETFVNPANQHFVRGKIHTTRVVGVAAENFGGMGVALTAGSNLGTVEVTRLSGTSLVSPITLNSGILRSWKVTPSVQPALPDRNITFTWPSQEDNSLDMITAILFKRTDGTQPFVALTAPTDVTGSDPHSITYSGIPSFSEFTVADLSNPLPLELLSFTGRNENGKGVLNWNTANEKDNLGFEVMKSLDGRVFDQIGFVAAENQSASYRFTDHNLNSGSYYKLIQKDVNGNRSESRVVYISTKGPEMVDMTLYPNPGTRGFSIRVNGFETSDQSLEISIFSIDGKSILNLEGNLSAVNQKVSYGLSDLPMGVYTIKILVDGTIHHLKWIKQ
ncbi:MAG TPA: T9SS type A sorting domain-containing protein, partial [Catalimonadaceae bacterium]|nr:T9SS type A sorting domain-containing protein [Catalimonadaceae bacterium]